MTNVELQQTATYAEWYRTLRDRRAKNRIVARLERLELGHFGDDKAVGDGVMELRLPIGPGYRIYLARRGDRIILLLCGGDKSSQQRDIARAKQLASELE